MRLGVIALAIFAATLVSSQASEIDTHSSSQLSKVIAKDIVRDPNNEPLYFSVRAGTIYANEIHQTASGDGIYYQFSGTVDINANGKVTTLQPGDGIFIRAGTKFISTTKDVRPSPTYLQFLLIPAPQSEVVEDANGTSVEVYRSPTPVPGLMQERNLLSLTRVPVPPQSPADPLHRRTGAALHYILSGVGAEFADGRAVARGPGSVSYEPAGLPYQWSNPGLNPLIYLLFNVNPKDVDPVVVLDQQAEDPFSRDPHLTWALYCIGISMILAVVISSLTTADFYAERRTGARRGKKWWEK
jgi:mannose-6-phosphate isomerase-like protein (cupin superfamily)